MKLTELQQFNAIIGLSQRIHGWPSTLLDLGYKLERVELRCKIIDKSRPGITLEINPDLLFLADSRNASLFAELKSGTYQGLGQLDKLIGLSPLELVRSAKITLRDLSTAASHKISVMQVINGEFLSQYLPEFERVNHSASLVAFMPASIKSFHGELRDEKAAQKFREGIPVDAWYPPTKLLRMLPTSSDKNDFIHSTINGVTNLWINNEYFIKVERIAELEFKQIWSAFEHSTQRRYLSEVKEILNDLSRSELHDYLRPAPVRDEWKFLMYYDSIDPRNKTRENKRFSNACQHYMWRRQKNIPYPRQYAAQPSFEDLEGYAIPPDKKQDDLEDESSS